MSVRPLRSLTETLTAIGNFPSLRRSLSADLSVRRSSSAALSVAWMAALTFRASKQVSSSRKSTPPSMRAFACSKYAASIPSKLQALMLGSLASEGRVRDLDVGPILPATSTLRGAESAASRAIWAARNAISAACDWQPYSSWEMELALKLLVSMMSAPASIYSLCMAAMTSGWLRFSASLFPPSP